MYTTSVKCVHLWAEEKQVNREWIQELKLHESALYEEFIVIDAHSKPQICAPAVSKFSYYLM